MNIITRHTLIEAGKLATLYAGKLRAEGYTPGKSRAVTPDKLMRCEFQNGALYKFTLPMGRLADWAALVESDSIEFNADKDNGTLTLKAGGSCAMFTNQTECKEDGLWEISPLYFNDGNDGRPGAELKLIPPAGLENLSASLKAQKAQGTIGKLRAKEINAKRDLKTAVTQHCARLALLAGGISRAISRARLLVKSLRMLRGALAAPMGIIPALGEWIEPAGEYDAGPVPHFTPEHAALNATLKGTHDAYKTWTQDKRFTYRGPKAEKLREAITRAARDLDCYIERAFGAEMEKNGLPAPMAYRMESRPRITVIDSKSYTRARLAVRSWSARKWELAQNYINALDARRKAQSKFDAAKVAETPTEPVELHTGNDAVAIEPEQTEVETPAQYVARVSKANTEKGFNADRQELGWHNQLGAAFHSFQQGEITATDLDFYRQVFMEATGRTETPIDEQLAPAPVVLPIADTYAALIAAVNRGDLPGAQQLAAQIAA